MFTWLSAPLVIMIILLLVVELVFRILKRLWKVKMEQMTEGNALWDDELYISYYQRTQILYVIRAWLIIVILFGLLSTRYPDMIGFFAIAAGAITIVFGSYLQSIVTYFSLLTILQVWDTVKIGKEYQWEVIKIRPMYLSLAWRNMMWEHTWELIQYPNYKVRWEPLVKVDLSLKGYHKLILTFLWSEDNFTGWLHKFISTLSEYLDEYLPVITPSVASHFKSYIWHRYKISCDYGEKWDVTVTVWTICLIRESPQKKQDIIGFIESLRSKNVQKV